MNRYKMIKVFVYWNLHKGQWSIKALEGSEKGKVVLWSDNVLLLGPKGKVSEAGRQRVLRDKRKNVHAGMVGYLLGLEPDDGFGGEKVTYNPYKYSEFVFSDTGKSFNAECGRYQYALLTGKSVFVL